MATFDFHRLSYGVDTDSIIQQFLSYGSLKTFAVSKPTATSFVLDPLGPVSVIYIGEKFKYTGGNDPKAGIITDLDVKAKGHNDLTFDINDVSIDIKEMKAAFATTSTVDDIIFVAKIFAGNDTFIGTTHDDKFYGLGGKDTLIGDKGDDSLNGGLGNDVLRGQSGADVLTGDGGKDSFVFDTSAKTTNNVDTITDFNVADDTIKLDSKSIYDGLGGKGTLDASLFHTGDHNDFKNGGITLESNGDLWYDPADRGAIKFAHIENGALLTHADIVII